MREPKPEWVAALQAVDGADAYIRWNDLVGRWAFGLMNADGVIREQFWGWFADPVTGERLAPDPVTGLYPFRDLDDTAMREALENLKRTFVGNPFDGAGSPRKEILRRKRWNQEMKDKKYREIGEGFAEEAAYRGRRLRGAPLIQVPIVLGSGKPTLTGEPKGAAA